MVTYVYILLTLHLFAFGIAVGEQRGDKLFMGLVRFGMYLPLYYYILTV